MGAGKDKGEETKEKRKVTVMTRINPDRKRDGSGKEKAAGGGYARARFIHHSWGEEHRCVGQPCKPCVQR
jgi:hypothetical protein